MSTASSLLRFDRCWGRSAGLLMLVGTTLLVPARARAGATCEWTDPAEDLKDHVKLAGPAGYADILTLRVGREGEVFRFEMGLAADIPSSPAFLLRGNGTKKLIWLWGIDTDPTAVGRGAPMGQGFPYGTGHPEEFFVQVEWDGEAFHGFVYDRRVAPVLVTPIAFAIDGSRIVAFVDAATLGDPAGFGVFGFTYEMLAATTSEGWNRLDRAFGPWNDYFFVWPCAEP